jgi:NAD(P)-dependent dehydrogenase (short-subunit alcohol dehydrogenase family)
MTKALVAELAEFNIRINCIAPGLFHTERADKLREGFDQAQIDHLVPLRYVADPKDLDGIILYLASNAASGYVTGSCITVDGGISWGG